jgi:hypothetical protein
VQVVPLSGTICTPVSRIRPRRELVARERRASSPSAAASWARLESSVRLIDALTWHRRPIDAAMAG